MAHINPKVMRAVEDALAADPKASLDDLIRQAAVIDRDVTTLTKRQFHARYPLQVKRKASPRKPGRRPRRPSRPKTPPTPRAASAGAVREVLLELATDLASADRGELVRIGARVDEYVTRVLEAAKG